MSELTDLGVKAIRDGVAGGSFTAREVAEAFNAAVAEAADLNAFIVTTPDHALAAADAADAKRAKGEDLGIMGGVPIGMKDLFATRGVQTTAASHILEGFTPQYESTVSQKLWDAGAGMLGKLNLDQFAMGSSNETSYFGNVSSPWKKNGTNAAMSPGGSSGGSSSAVAARIAPAATGTDTGGSVRLPAAWCGLVGLKTTIGRVSTYGVLPLAATLDTPGPMTRSVEDAALLYNAMQGPDPLDKATRGVAFADPLPHMKRGIAGLKLAVMPAGEREGVEAEVLAAFDASLETLRSLGATVSEIALPRVLASLGGMTGRIIGAEGYLEVGDRVDDMNLQIDEAVRPRIWIGRDLSARDYLETLRKREIVKLEFDAALAGYDALLTPTVATPAIPIDAIDQSTTPAGFTRAVNLLDRCALSIPNGFTAGELPLSLHIVCDAYDEAMALRIGWAYEQATDWGQRRPPAYG